MHLKPWDWKNIKGDDQEFWGQMPAKEVYQFSMELKKKNLNKVYDLGCGIGRNLFYLIDNDFDVHGSDLSKHAVDEINQKLKEKNIHT